MITDEVSCHYDDDFTQGSLTEGSLISLLLFMQNRLKDYLQS